MFSFIFSLVFCCCNYAQDKLEKEIRIDISQVPAQAQAFLNQFQFQKKVKWYKEISLEGITVEAKTKHQGQRYSIEFNDKGVLEDIEIKLNFNQLPQMTKKNITDYLNTTFEAYKIKKIQIQYTGDPQQVFRAVTTAIQNTIVVKYEVVVKGKTSEATHLFEVLFSEAGIMEKKRKIVVKSTNHLEF